jgi:hypothetical protein
MTHRMITKPQALPGTAAVPLACGAGEVPDEV